MPADELAGRAPPFTCPHYDPVPGGRRCRQYLDGGACARPDEFMCVEWLKANGHPVPPPLTPPLDASPPSPTLPDVTSDGPPARALTDEHIASFKALGAEACIAFDGGGSVWLVPDYTGADREEISIDHAATLASLCAVFPGARIRVLRRSPGPAEAAKQAPVGGGRGR